MEVSELNHGQWFRSVSCGGMDDYLYIFLRNQKDEKGKLKNSLIRCIAAHWPRNGRGKNQPEQWLLCSEHRTENCNPYYEVRVIEFPLIDGVPLHFN